MHVILCSAYPVAVAVAVVAVAVAVSVAVAVAVVVAFVRHGFNPKPRQHACILCMPCIICMHA